MMTGFHRSTFALVLLVPTFLLARGGGDGSPADSSIAGTVAAADPTDAYWANLQAHCGNAFPGRLGVRPEGDEMVTPADSLVVVFDVCGEDEIRLPFHIHKDGGEWDRSRTWIFRRTEDGRIELRHDHRQRDGTEDRSTWYGAFSGEEGAVREPIVHEYLREQPGPDGDRRGWRIIIEPGVRYHYGTIRDGEWRWRVEFDLSSPLTELPPPAWGYEGGRGPLR